MTQREGWVQVAEAPVRPIERQPTLAETAYARILGELAPGRALGNVEHLLAPDLAVWLSMSPTPVREALHRLCLIGVLEPTGRKGFVRRRMTLREVEEHFELRLLLEPMAARLAAQRRVDVDRLRQTLRERRSDGPVGRVQLHVAVADEVGFPILAEIIKRLADQVAGQHPGDVAPHDMQRLTDGHERVLAALESGDPELAETAMREHLETTRDLVRPLVAARGREAAGHIRTEAR